MSDAFTSVLGAGRGVGLGAFVETPEDIFASLVVDFGDKSDRMFNLFNALETLSPSQLKCLSTFKADDVHASTLAMGLLSSSEYRDSYFEFIPHMYSQLEKTAFANCDGAVRERTTQKILGQVLYILVGSQLDRKSIKTSTAAWNKAMAMAKG